MAATELRPCPFCGSVPVIADSQYYDYDGGDRWYVYSADVICGCGCTFHIENPQPKEYVSGDHAYDFAIDTWNRRADACDR